MKSYIYVPLLLIVLMVFSCKKDQSDSGSETRITSEEFEDELLFVNKRDFKIKTSEAGQFSSTDQNIKITPSGVIERIASGEVAPIDIAWSSGGKSRIYAVGATDDNYNEPNASFNGLAATNAYNDYRKGWQTLQKLGGSDETYGIVLRHADADNGRDFNEESGPANWWKSCGASNARQLNEQGKARAAELGKIYKDLNLPIERVFSSEFCRAKQTAELLETGKPIQIANGINHPAYNVSGKRLFVAMQDILSAQPRDSKITIMVSHHPVNETYRTPYPGFPDVIAFPWTSSYFVKVNSDKNLSYEGAASWGMFKYWRDKKLNRL